jgi:hypothetical protein
MMIRWAAAGNARRQARSSGARNFIESRIGPIGKAAVVSQFTQSKGGSQLVPSPVVKKSRRMVKPTGCTVVKARKKEQAQIVRASSPTALAVGNRLSTMAGIMASVNHTVAVAANAAYAAGQLPLHPGWAVTGRR